MKASKFYLSIASGVAGVLIYVGSFSTAALSDDRAKWQFSEYNDPSNKGRTTARLTLGVPETDAAQFSAICSASNSTRVENSVIELSMDVGNKRDGEDIEVLFSGGGFAHTVKGEVYGQNAEVGISGVVIRPKHNDKLWAALTEKNALDYVVLGFRASTLNLANNKAQIESFIRACRDYADAARTTANASDPQSSATGSPSAQSGLTEKEAFENAKDLNTIEGWEAFLNSYNTGFRADLARAYVKRLTSEARATPAPPRATTDNTPSRQTVNLRTLDPGPGTTPWVTGKKRLATTGNKAVYSASVRAKGVELTTYCVDWSQTGGIGQGIFAILKEYPPSAYPEYNQRIKQALTNAGTHQSGHKKIRVLFSSGIEAPSMTAHQSSANGELMIGTAGQAISQGTALSSMLTEQSMTVLAPPFSSTLQLTGSREAICRMANRCGADVAGCAGLETPTAERYTPAPKKRPVKKVRKKKRKKKKNLARTKYDAKRGCRRGTRYVGGKCRNASNASQFCGPGYAPRNGKCTQGASYNF
ncbi:MAG: hypothetical protein ACRBCJ_14390 [Hyphomicrobiaceae bacterium]